MRTHFFVICFTILSMGIFAQKDNGIKVVQDGEKINIFYKIDGSKSDQLYTVTITCKMGGKEKFVLKSVTGDVGENIKGGKKEYKAVWDVLKDVDELTEAEFFVKPVLTKDVKPEPEVKPVVTENPKPEKPATDVIKERPWFVAYNGGLSKTILGARAGYMKNWGFFAEFRSDAGISFSGGATKRVVNKTHFKLHTYLGMGYGDWVTVEENMYSQVYDEFGNPVYDNSGYPVFSNYTTTSNSDGLEILYGLIGSYKRFVFSMGLTHLLAYKTGTDFTFGIGINF